MDGIFTSKRLVYRSIEPEDDAFLRAYLGDSEAQAQSTYALLKPTSKQSIESRRDAMLNKDLLGVVLCLPGADSTEGGSPATPIGILHLGGLAPRVAHNRNTDIGVGVMKQYRGQGYGSEAIVWALDWAFRSAGMHRVGIGAFSFNTGALSLYERLGFKVEGRKREGMWYDGGWHDIVELGMVESEWRALKDKNFWH